MAIQVTAPTRIDLAGGTIDIWPIYLSLTTPMTLNLAIDLFAKVTIRKRRDKKIIIKSVDGNEEVTAHSPEELEQIEALPLPVTVLRYFSPARGLELTTEAMSPRGAGIAGSSALLIALIAGLSKFCKKRISQDQMIQLARDLECKVIHVPSGVQDYFPAIKGGLQAIYLDTGRIHSKKLKCSIAEIGKRIVLCYTGQPRNSGINNWEVTKRFIDGDTRIRSILRHISEVSVQLHDTLSKKKYDDVGPLIQKEWGHRLSLSSGISTPKIDEIMNAARRAGATGGKVCGAGGGGCVMLYCHPNDHDAVSESVALAGAKLIPFKPVSDGIKIKNVR